MGTNVSTNANAGHDEAPNRNRQPMPPQNLVVTRNPLDAPSHRIASSAAPPLISTITTTDDDVVRPFELEDDDIVHEYTHDDTIDEGQGDQSKNTNVIGRSAVASSPLSATSTPRNNSSPRESTSPVRKDNSPPGQTSEIKHQLPSYPQRSALRTSSNVSTSQSAQIHPASPPTARKQESTIGLILRKGSMSHRADNEDENKTEDDRLVEGPPTVVGGLSSQNVVAATTIGGYQGSGAGGSVSKSSAGSGASRNTKGRNANDAFNEQIMNQRNAELAHRTLLADDQVTPQVQQRRGKRNNNSNHFDDGDGRLLLGGLEEGHDPLVTGHIGVRRHRNNSMEGMENRESPPAPRSQRLHEFYNGDDTSGASGWKNRDSSAIYSDVFASANISTAHANLGLANALFQRHYRIMVELYLQASAKEASFQTPYESFILNERYQCFLTDYCGANVNYLRSVPADALLSLEETDSDEASDTDDPNNKNNADEEFFNKYQETFDTPIDNARLLKDSPLATDPQASLPAHGGVGNNSHVSGLFSSRLTAGGDSLFATMTAGGTSSSSPISSGVFVPGANVLPVIATGMTSTLSEAVPLPSSLLLSLDAATTSPTDDASSFNVSSTYSASDCNEHTDLRSSRRGPWEATRKSNTRRLLNNNPTEMEAGIEKAKVQRHFRAFSAVFQQTAEKAVSCICNDLPFRPSDQNIKQFWVLDGLFIYEWHLPPLIARSLANREIKSAKELLQLGIEGLTCPAVTTVTYGNRVFTAMALVPIQLFRSNARPGSCVSRRFDLSPKVFSNRSADIDGMISEVALTLAIYPVMNGSYEVHRGLDGRTYFIGNLLWFAPYATLNVNACLLSSVGPRTGPAIRAPPRPQMQAGSRGGPMDGYPFGSGRPSQQQQSYRMTANGELIAVDIDDFFLSPNNSPSRLVNPTTPTEILAMRSEDAANYLTTLGVRGVMWAPADWLLYSRTAATEEAAGANYYRLMGATTAGSQSPYTSLLNMSCGVPNGAEDSNMTSPLNNNNSGSPNTPSSPSGFYGQSGTGAENTAPSYLNPHAIVPTTASAAAPINMAEAKGSAERCMQHVALALQSAVAVIERLVEEADVEDDRARRQVELDALDDDDEDLDGTGFWAQRIGNSVNGFNNSGTNRPTSTQSADHQLISNPIQRDNSTDIPQPIRRGSANDIYNKDNENKNALAWFVKQQRDSEAAARLGSQNMFAPASSATSYVSTNTSVLSQAPHGLSAGGRVTIALLKKRLLIPSRFILVVAQALMGKTKYLHRLDPLFGYVIGKAVRDLMTSHTANELAWSYSQTQQKNLGGSEVAAATDYAQQFAASHENIRTGLAPKLVTDPFSMLMQQELDTTLNSHWAVATLIPAILARFPVVGNGVDLFVGHVFFTARMRREAVKIIDRHIQRETQIEEDEDKMDKNWNSDDESEAKTEKESQDEEADGKNLMDDFEREAAALELARKKKAQEEEEAKKSWWFTRVLKSMFGAKTSTDNDDQSTSAVNIDDDKKSTQNNRNSSERKLRASPNSPTVDQKKYRFRCYSKPLAEPLNILIDNDSAHSIAAARSGLNGKHCRPLTMPFLIRQLDDLESDITAADVNRVQDGLLEVGGECITARLRRILGLKLLYRGFKDDALEMLKMYSTWFDGYSDEQERNNNVPESYLDVQIICQLAVIMSRLNYLKVFQRELKTPTVVITHPVEPTTHTEATTAKTVVLDKAANEVPSQLSAKSSTPFGSDLVRNPSSGTMEGHRDEVTSLSARAPTVAASTSDSSHSNSQSRPRLVPAPSTVTNSSLRKSEQQSSEGKDVVLQEETGTEAVTDGFTPRNAILDIDIDTSKPVALEHKITQQIAEVMTKPLMSAEAFARLVHLFCAKSEADQLLGIRRRLTLVNGRKSRLEKVVLRAKAKMTALMDSLIFIEEFSRGHLPRGWLNPPLYMKLALVLVEKEVLRLVLSLQSTEAHLQRAQRHLQKRALAAARLEVATRRSECFLIERQMQLFGSGTTFDDDHPLGRISSLNTTSQGMEERRESLVEITDNAKKVLQALTECSEEDLCQKVASHFMPTSTRDELEKLISQQSSVLTIRDRLYLIAEFFRSHPLQEPKEAKLATDFLMPILGAVQAAYAKEEAAAKKRKQALRKEKLRKEKEQKDSDRAAKTAKDKIGGEISTTQSSSKTSSIPKLTLSSTEEPVQRGDKINLNPAKIEVGDISVEGRPEAISGTGSVPNLHDVETAAIAHTHAAVPQDQDIGLTDEEAKQLSLGHDERHAAAWAAVAQLCAHIMQLALDCFDQHLGSASDASIAVMHTLATFLYTTGLRVRGIEVAKAAVQLSVLNTTQEKYVHRYTSLLLLGRLQARSKLYKQSAKTLEAAELFRGLAQNPNAAHDSYSSNINLQGGKSSSNVTSTMVTPRAANAEEQTSRIESKMTDGEGTKGSDESTPAIGVSKAYRQSAKESALRAAAATSSEAEEKKLTMEPYSANEIIVGPQDADEESTYTLQIDNLLSKDGEQTHRNPKNTPSQTKTTTIAFLDENGQPQDANAVPSYTNAKSVSPKAKRVVMAPSTHSTTRRGNSHMSAEQRRIRKVQLAAESEAATRIARCWRAYWVAYGSKKRPPAPVAAHSTRRTTFEGLSGISSQTTEEEFLKPTFVTSSGSSQQTSEEKVTPLPGGSSASIQPNEQRHGQPQGSALLQAMSEIAKDSSTDLPPMGNSQRTASPPMLKQHSPTSQTTSLFPVAPLNPSAFASLMNRPHGSSITYAKDRSSLPDFPTSPSRPQQLPSSTSTPTAASSIVDPSSPMARFGASIRGSPHSISTPVLKPKLLAPPYFPTVGTITNTTGLFASGGGGSIGGPLSSFSHSTSNSQSNGRTSTSLVAGAATSGTTFYGSFFPAYNLQGSLSTPIMNAVNGLGGSSTASNASTGLQRPVGTVNSPSSTAPGTATFGPSVNTLTLFGSSMLHPSTPLNPVTSSSQKGGTLRTGYVTLDTQPTHAEALSSALSVGGGGATTSNVSVHYVPSGSFTTGSKTTPSMLLQRMGSSINNSTLRHTSVATPSISMSREDSVIPFDDDDEE